MNTHITRIMLAVVMSVCALMSAFAQQSQTTRPEIAVIYYPHWHPYDHGSAWKGEGWTNGSLSDRLRVSPVMFNPQTDLGYFDESTRRGRQRRRSGRRQRIDVFVYDWYWYSGVQNMQEALEKVSSKRRTSRLKFALWANTTGATVRPEHAAAQRLGCTLPFGEDCLP